MYEDSQAKCQQKVVHEPWLGKPALCLADNAGDLPSQVPDMFLKICVDENF